VDCSGGGAREKLSCLREGERGGEGEEVVKLNEERDKRSKLLERRKRRREERRKMERIETMERLCSARRVRKEAISHRRWGKDDMMATGWELFWSSLDLSFLLSSSYN
jgi:hypothetical protein